MQFKFYKCTFIWINFFGRWWTIIHLGLEWTWNVCHRRWNQCFQTNTCEGHVEPSFYWLWGWCWTLLPSLSRQRLKIELEWPGCWPWMLYLSCGIHKTRSAGKRGQNLCLFSWLRTNRFLDLFSSTYCNYMYTSIRIIKRDGLKTFLKCYHDLEDQYSITSIKEDFTFSKVKLDNRLLHWSKTWSTASFFTWMLKKESK